MATSKLTVEDIQKIVDIATKAKLKSLSFDGLTIELNESGFDPLAFKNTTEDGFSQLQNLSWEAQEERTRLK